jgi:hypothetical protein
MALKDYYPPGAAHDPHAPYNQRDPDDEAVCSLCGEPLGLDQTHRFGPLRAHLSCYREEKAEYDHDAREDR